MINIIIILLYYYFNKSKNIEILNKMHNITKHFTK